MPRRIDTEARRQQIAEAVWHCLASSGQASVRAVAATAGLAKSALAHQYGDATSMVDDALARAGQRMTAWAEAATRDPSATVADVVAAVLPNGDADRSVVWRAWLAGVAVGLVGSVAAQRDHRIASALQAVARLQGLRMDETATWALLNGMDGTAMRILARSGNATAAIHADAIRLIADAAMVE